MNESVILASASPRRRELLKLIVPTFETAVSDAEERVQVPKDLPLEQLPEFFARVKAEDIASRYPDQLVIGSDTGVLTPGADGQLQMLGKPVDEADARRMLRLLSGQKHWVSTGCCLCYQGRSRSFSEIAEVEFYPLTEQEIADYTATGEPMDKAGAYGIQGRGALLVKRIEGDYYNVMGLPAGEVYHRLKELGAI